MDDIAADKLGEMLLHNLSRDLERFTLEPGEILFRQGDPGDTLYIVIKGQLNETVAQEDGSELHLGLIDPGELVGKIQSLQGGKRTAKVHAVCRTELLRLSKTAFENLTPTAIQELHEIVRQRLRRNHLAIVLQDLFATMSPAMLKKLESRLHWLHLSKGEVLFRQGEWGDSLYIIVSGRVQALFEDEDGVVHVVRDAVRGEVIGEMALLVGQRRSATVRSIRDSDLVEISKEVSEKLFKEDPEILPAITRMLVRRMQQDMHPSWAQRKDMHIAVVAAHGNAPLADFAERLCLALGELAPTLHLNSRRLDGLIQIEGISQVSEENPYRVSLSAWLDEQETKCRYILYEADAASTPWTKRCVQRADHIIILAQASEYPLVDRSIAAMVSPVGDMDATRRSLVLLQSDRSVPPRETRRWKDLLQVQKHYHLAAEADDQYRRLARILAGRAIGVVLSGGGACGFAHIGVLQAIEEAGVPIDLIGGTSMGATIASLYAMGLSCQDMILICRRAFIDSRPFRDLTLPLISFIRCRKFDNIVKRVYGETMIEDLWTNFFCVSTSLTTARPVVHHSGLLWRAVRASSSLPGIATPLIEENELLVDGGVLNNLPVDVMKKGWDCFTIAVNATGGSDNFTVQRHEVPSPLELLRDRIFRSGHYVRFPSLFQILSRASTVSSIPKMKLAQAESDLFLSPPLSNVGMFDFDDIDRIVAIGYDYAKDKIAEWKESADK
jgi:predicted acylesterase/phospholipase RssA/CRP-like cAMP-binding protein